MRYRGSFWSLHSAFITTGGGKKKEHHPHTWMMLSSLVLVGQAGSYGVPLSVPLPLRDC